METLALTGNTFPRRASVIRASIRLSGGVCPWVNLNLSRSTAKCGSSVELDPPEREGLGRHFPTIEHNTMLEWLTQKMTLEVPYWVPCGAVGIFLFTQIVKFFAWGRWVRKNKIL